ncbi:unnamed protein product [Caenorhabditis nigoni]
MNYHLLDLNIQQIWNGCNGLPIDIVSELSLDATPRNHYFMNMSIPKPPAKRRYVCVQRYFEEKYNISLNQPHSPLFRDQGGRMYPVEAVWLRIRLF